MRRCCVPGCMSNCTKPYVSVFIFPKDLSVVKTWLKNIGRPDLKVNENIGVCIKHFEKDCILGLSDLEPTRKKLTLKHGAVPTLFGDQCTSYIVKRLPVKRKPKDPASRDQITSELSSASSPETSKKSSKSKINSSPNKMIPTTDKPIIAVLKADDSKNNSPEKLEKMEEDEEMEKETNSTPVVFSPNKSLLNASLCLKEDDKITVAQAVKRSLSTGSNSSTGSLETPKSSSASAPKRRKIEKPAPMVTGCDNDCYCWICHRENINISCFVCPRAFHLKCAGPSTELVPQWVCLECERAVAADETDARSSVLTELTVDQLASLLKHSLAKMKSRAPIAFHQPVSLEHYPSYLHYVIYPMDFSLLEKNIKKHLYGSPEAFLSDVRWIVHNSCVFNGSQHPLSTNAKALVKMCEHDMQEIEICPDCFVHSVVRNKYWFSEVCKKPHPLVWAKLKGFPYWPAKVVRIVDGNVDARFFGAHDRAWVPMTQCYHLSKEMPTSSKPKKKGNYEVALDELNMHVHYLIERFGSFDYAPYRTVFNPENKELMYHGIDINKPVKKDNVFVSPVSPVKIHFHCPEKENRFPCSTESVSEKVISDPDAEKDVLSDSPKDLQNSEGVPVSQPFSERNRDDPHLPPCPSLSCENKASPKDAEKIVKVDKVTNSTVSSPSKTKIESSLENTAHLFGLTLQRIKGIVSCTGNSQGEACEENKNSGDKIGEESVKTVINNSSQPETSLPDDTSNLTFTENEKRSLAEDNSVPVSRSAKNDSFILKLAETIESCKAKLGISEVTEVADDLPSENETGDELEDSSEDADEENESSSSDEEDSSSDNDNGDDENESISEEVAEGPEDTDETNNDSNLQHNRMESEESSSDSDSDEESESSGTIEILENSNSPRAKEPEISDQNQQIADSRAEVEDDSIKEIDSQDTSNNELNKDGDSESNSVNLVNSENAKSFEDESNSTLNDAEKVNESICSTMDIDKPADHERPEKNTEYLHNTAMSEHEKVIDSITSVLNECTNSSVNKIDEDDDILICNSPPRKVKTPPLIVLDDGMDTEPEKETRESNYTSVKAAESTSSDSSDDQTSSSDDATSDDDDVNNLSKPLKNSNEVESPSKLERNNEKKVAHVENLHKGHSPDNNSRKRKLSSEESSDESSDDDVQVVPHEMRLTGAIRTFKKQSSGPEKKSLTPNKSYQILPTSAVNGDQPLDANENNGDDSVVSNSKWISGQLPQSIPDPKKVGRDPKDEEIHMLKSKLKDLFGVYQKQVWKATQEKLEFRHNANRILMEMRASFEIDKKQAIEKLNMKFEKEKNLSIEETKRKQWCAQCLQESRYACCWNTSYCSVDCQRNHFPQHRNVCTQLKLKNSNDPLETKKKVISQAMNEGSDVKKRVIFVNMPNTSNDISKSSTLTSTTSQATTNGPQIHFMSTKSQIQIVPSAASSNPVQFSFSPAKTCGQTTTTNISSKNATDVWDLDVFNRVGKKWTSRKCDLSTAVALLHYKKNQDSSLSIINDLKKSIEASKADDTDSSDSTTYELNLSISNDTSKAITEDDADNIGESDDDVVPEVDLILSDGDEEDLETINIGHGLEVKAKLVKKSMEVGKSARKLTRCLVDVLFPNIKLLATCSALGHNSSITKLTQAALPSRKVAAIIDFVQRRYPATSRIDIISAINMKCKEARLVLNMLRATDDATKKKPINCALKTQDETNLSTSTPSSIHSSVSTVCVKNTPNVVCVKSPLASLTKNSGQSLLKYNKPVVIAPKPTGYIPLTKPKPTFHVATPVVVKTSSLSPKKQTVKSLLAAGKMKWPVENVPKDKPKFVLTVDKTLKPIAPPFETSSGSSLINPKPYIIYGNSSNQASDSQHQSLPATPSLLKK